MNRVDRLFGIMTMLQSKKYVTAEKIAESFGISVRTVYRDVKALGEQGMPIGFEPHKGYFVVQGYFLPPVSFSSEEASALLLMEAMVFGFTDKSIQTHYATALNKVKAVLRTTQKEQLDFLHHHIKMQLPACFNNDYEYLALIQQAISTKCLLEIGYKNNKEEVSQRRVEPIGLIFYAFNWHLIGWCHHRQDYRDFRVSRILTLKNTELPFLKPDHMAIGEYMKQLPVAY
ncbi:helix-turn-helix transcriptional regulator [Rufibacter glacialis]|uniref:Helix-turn-helix transcriptional regulator n=1 Tax=Rufibacter glacialis TaxID=1259555 RepID=A0A5M8Q312_9BACT|nr:YafY family protein [Rufibacter glacialis]KAA6430277.1 YafY family transcriptional regulator [Rufibacter glacialis]GGK87898.1 transcriptional regulator [Rufibacter glacialis]